MSPAQRAIIWDMDGVLIDSGDLHYQAWRDTLAVECRIVLTRPAFDATFGRDNFQTLAMLLGTPPTAEQMARIASRKEERYRKLAAEHIRPVPGALELMRGLAAAGWQQAIATSAPRENLDLIIRLLSLDRWLAARVCVDDVANGKPDPALFLLAAERMAVPAGRCVVIEDSPAGVAAARAAGMIALAVTTTHPKADFAGAARVVRSLEQVTSEDVAALLEA